MSHESSKPVPLAELTPTEIRRKFEIIETDQSQTVTETGSSTFTQGRFGMYLGKRDYPCSCEREEEIPPDGYFRGTLPQSDWVVQTEDSKIFAAQRPQPLSREITGTISTCPSTIDSSCDCDSPGITEFRFALADDPDDLGGTTDLVFTERVVQVIRGFTDQSTDQPEVQ